MNSDGELYQLHTPDMQEFDDYLREQERLDRQATLLEEAEVKVIAGTPQPKRVAKLLGLRKNSYRNRPCMCGSGKKFKKCCINKPDEELKELLLWANEMANYE